MNTFEQRDNTSFSSYPGGFPQKILFLTTATAEPAPSLSRNFSNLAERPIQHRGAWGSTRTIARSGFSICRHTSGNTFSFLVSLRVDLSYPYPPPSEQSVAKSQTESNFLANGGCRTNCHCSFDLAFPFSVSLHSSDRWECPAVLSDYAFQDDAPVL